MIQNTELRNFLGSGATDTTPNNMTRVWSNAEASSYGAYERYFLYMRTDSSAASRTAETPRALCVK